MEHREHNTTPTTPDAPSSTTPTAPPHTSEKDDFFGELIRFGIIALLVVLPIRLFIAQPFIVSGASMEDTFVNGQYLIVDQVTYRFTDPERGDVIVFKYPRDHSKYFIKRVIGLPGDTVRISEDTVTVTDATGVVTTLEEPYVAAMTQDTPIEQALGVDEYFVMGDNRNASSDSRVWGILTRDEIVGRAYIRLFPIHTIDFLPGEYNSAT